MKISNRVKGAVIACALSVVVLYIFFGKILTAPNRYFFSADGDGLQSYYTAYYHIRYDSSYSLFSGMNYPYPEHVMFSNCQPAVTNVMKLFNRWFFDISGYVPAVFNLLMLFSIVLAALFLYLLLTGLNIGVVYSITVSAGLAFLSPQLYRFGGHYSLSYVFFIPVVFYFILRFDRHPSYLKSIIFGIFILLMASFHAYYFAFGAFIMAGYWLYKVFAEYKTRKLYIPSIHILIQLVIPYFLLAAWSYFSSAAGDRTSFPSGFLTYKTTWEGIFLTEGSGFYGQYGNFIHAIRPDWEGWAFIGKTAAVGCFFIFHLFSAVFFYPSDHIHLAAFILTAGIGFIIFMFFKRWKNPLKLTDHRLLNVFLWTSVAALLFSYAWPFTFLPRLLEYSGSLRQFRAVGRFSWIFFWMANIAAFYLLYHLKVNKYLKYSFWVLAFVFLFHDAWNNTRHRPTQLANRIVAMEDRGNRPDEYEWLNKINVKEFQAIIPLPYFHNGSENLGINPEQGILKDAIIASWKSGLPMTASFLSRTSLSRSKQNIEMYLEPYRRPQVLDDFPSKKPFLVMVKRNVEISGSGSEFIRASTKIYSSSGYDFYSLGFRELESVYDSIEGRVRAEISEQELFRMKEWISPDSVMDFIFNDFKNVNPGKQGYFTRGQMEKEISDGAGIYEGFLPGYHANERWLLSFWFYGIDRDILPRTVVKIEIRSGNHYIFSPYYWRLASGIKCMDGSWGLFEMPFELETDTNKIRIRLENKEISKGYFIIDNLLLHPEKRDIFFKGKDYLFKNNRYYRY